jgi:hypothetical protein
MDLDSISLKNLDLIAQYISVKQIGIISKDIQEFLNALTKRLPEFNNDPIFVLTGLSADFLVKKVLLKLGFSNILNYEKITKIPDHISSSAFAVAGAFYFQL